MRQRKGNSVGDRLLMILVGLFLYAPIIILIVFSFNAGNSSSVWKGFSLHWYAELLNDRLIMHSVYTTLLVSLLATVIATVAGTFAAIGFYGMRRRARTGLMAVNNIPMMNADIVTGVSLCLLFVVFFNGWHSFAVWVNGWQSLVVLPERLTLGFGTLLIAHICFNIPYVILSVGPKLRQMDRNLVDAAQDLGCTWMQAFWKVIIPEIKPGIVSGALTAFTMSIDDFIISYFTAGTSSSTLAMTIYGMTKKRVSPEINAVSTLLFVTVIILLAIINLRENHAEHHRNVHHESATFAPAPKKYPGLGKKIAAGAMACVLLAVLIVTGAAARSERVVNVCSWGEYIDESLITEFEEKTGIRVNYQTAESNEALYSLIKMGGADFDVIVPSDYMIARLIQEDMLAELDYAAIPNFQLMDPQFTHLSFDPENKYTVPYTWGSVGIIYNTTMVDEAPTCWADLWDEQYAGNILMFDNSRDAYAIAAFKGGHSINPATPEEVDEVVEELKAQKPLVQAYVMDEIFDKMIGGEAAIGVYYSGDAITMIDDNPDLAWVFPQEGSVLSVDCMAVPAASEHKEAAEMFINFMCETDIGKANSEYIGYTTPMHDVWEVLDEDLKSSEIAYPSEEDAAREKVFTALSDEVNSELDLKWSEMKSYDEGGGSYLFLLLLLAMLALACFNIWRKVRRKTRNQY